MVFGKKRPIFESFKRGDREFEDNLRVYNSQYVYFTPAVVVRLSCSELREFSSPSKRSIFYTNTFFYIL